MFETSLNDYATNDYPGIQKV